MTACDRLGPPYAPVMSAMLGALVNLLAGLPQLPEMTLMDDTPTGNAETRAWLAGLMEGRTAPAVPQVSPGGRRTSVVQAVDALYIRALDEARSGRTRQGIELLMREAERERTLRAKFLRRSQAAELMVGAGLEAVALPILRELHGIVEGHKLEDWVAADIVVQPMALLYRGLLKIEGDSDGRPEGSVLPRRTKAWSGIALVPPRKPEISVKLAHDRLQPYSVVSLVNGQDIYYSRTGGKSWLQIRSGSPHLDVKQIHWNARTATLYVGTADQGIYRLNLGPLIEEYAAE